MIRWRVNLPKAAKAELREESLKYERKEKGLGKTVDAREAIAGIRARMRSGK